MTETFDFTRLVADLPKVKLLDGNEYQVVPMNAVTFKRFMTIREPAAKMADGDELVDADAVVDTLYAVAAACVPGAPVEVVNQLDVIMVRILINCAQGRVAEVMELAKNGDGVAPKVSPSSPPTPTPSSSSPSREPSGATPAT